MNSPIVVQPNWGEPASISNYTYGGLEFVNVLLLLTPEQEMLDAVTLLPFSAAAGLGNVRGDVSVYASAACHCCAVNSFCDKGSACSSANLPLNLSCHGASTWPYVA